MHTTHFKSQSGAALVVSLLILLVMTVIGISSMRTTNLQEKMASNTREREQAFEAAESALEAHTGPALGQAARLGALGRGLSAWIRAREAGQER